VLFRIPQGATEPLSAEAGWTPSSILAAHWPWPMATVPRRCHALTNRGAGGSSAEMLGILPGSASRPEYGDSQNDSLTNDMCPPDGGAFILPSVVGFLTDRQTCDNIRQRANLLVRMICQKSRHLLVVAALVDGHFAQQTVCWPSRA
jgi:hypothetical protein